MLDLLQKLRRDLVSDVDCRIAEIAAQLAPSEAQTLIPLASQGFGEGVIFTTVGFADYLSNLSDLNRSPEIQSRQSLGKLLSEIAKSEISVSGLRIERAGRDNRGLLWQVTQVVTNNRTSDSPDDILSRNHEDDTA